MNTTYQSTQSSSEVDFSDEINELVEKLKSLELDNEILNKNLRESAHTLNIEIEKLKVENESLKRSNLSLEELLKNYKLKNQSIKRREDSHDYETEKNQLEIKVLELEESHQELIRKLQNLQHQNEDLLIKIQFNEISKLSENIPLNEIDEDLFDLDNLDDEGKEVIKEIIREYNIIKKENLLLKEKLYEKNKESILLRNRTDQNPCQAHEINVLKEKIKELETKSNNDEKDNYNSIDSLNSAERQFSEELSILREQIEENQKLYFEEKEKMQLEIENQKTSYEFIIRDLKLQIEDQIIEIKRYETEKNAIESDFQFEANTEKILATELERYQSKVFELEDIKDKNEKRHLNEIRSLQIKNEETNHHLALTKEKLKKVEEEHLTLQKTYSKVSKELSEITEKFNNQRDRELLKLKNENDCILRENDHLKNDKNNLKTNIEKAKEDYNNLVAQINELMLEKEEEEKKFEMKIQELEKKMADKGASRRSSKRLKKVERKSEDIILNDILEEPPQESISQDYSKIKFNNRISYISYKSGSFINDVETNNNINNINLIEELNSKINQYQADLKEFEALKKENIKLKKDIIENNELSEAQIKELFEKISKLTMELQNTKKKSREKKSLDNEMNVSNLIAENEFLKREIETLKNEIIEINKINDKTIAYMKTEVINAENMAVQAKVNYATLAYDKDSEMIKLKNTIKRLRGNKV